MGFFKLIVVSWFCFLFCACSDGNRKGDSTSQEKALAELSAEDRVAVEKQKLCPVSDEPLGSMSTPIKVSAKGQTFFIC